MDIFSFGMCALEVPLAPWHRSLLPATRPHLTCAVPSGCLTWLCPQMAVLEIQANGDTRVTEEAIARARHSLSDPNMRVSSLLGPWGRTGEVFPLGLEVQRVSAAEACEVPSAQGPTYQEGLT